ncbi:MAG: hypothetical protein KDK23_14135 [Leptospiraceae bacterium]|nr:hypothetical protein [Leptospiraceae bacterium]
MKTNTSHFLFVSRSARSLWFQISILLLSLACHRPEPVQPTNSNQDSPENSEEPALRMDADRIPPGPHKDWKIWIGGWGKLKIGMKLAEVTDLLSFSLDSQTDPEPGQECFVLVPADAPASYSFMFIGHGEAAILARIYISATRTQTISGISVGSPDSAVRRAYGAKLHEEPHKYVDGWKELIYTPVDDQDKHLRLVFTTDGESVKKISVGRLPEVLYVEGCS